MCKLTGNTITLSSRVDSEPDRFTDYELKLRALALDNTPVL
jgi:hypothetical protein